MRHLLPRAASAHATTKVIGLFASSLTLMALGGAVPIFLRPWPTHWLNRLLCGTTLAISGALSTWALLAWVVYLGRLRAQLSTPTPPTDGPDARSTPDQQRPAAD